MRKFVAGTVIVAGTVVVFVLAAAERALAADDALLTKASPATSAYDWSGSYVGPHYGYAAGSSKWSATQGGATTPSLSGSLNFFNPYDIFTGNGSYFLGLQAGYNYMLPSRLVLGIEADASFPSLLGGSQAISSPSIGQASYGETGLTFGTVRARIGYAPANWLFYVTGGFAWTYDQLARTQMAGIPAGGTAVPVTTETALLWRLGWALGLGVEIPIATKWTAKIEYLHPDFGSGSVTFPGAAQQFGSDLSLNELRAGLNYRFGSDATNVMTARVAPEADRFSIHGQTTFVEQGYPAFRSPYEGPSSLTGGAQGRETWDTTLYLGTRLWQGAEFWIDPEVYQGFGLDGTHGVAGFTNGEAYKVGANYPYSRIQRAFIRQTIDFGGDTQKVDAGFNQFAQSQTADRLVLTVGKFDVADVFDNNKYAHDPRSDFLNWAIIDTGTFDYAADALGFTIGAAAEWYHGNWTLRGGFFDLSVVPASVQLNPSFQEFQWVGEIERRYNLWGHPGKMAISGFLSRGGMGSFENAVALTAVTGGPADIAAVRQYQSRGGVSMNIEQEITSDLGTFVRAGWADGNIEPYAFTDIDRTVAGGISLSGKQWGRPDDTVGLAGVVNGISAQHAAFLNDGGLGIVVGDGQLPNPGLETIIEAYYSYALSKSTRVSADYQLVVNPAYATERGPVNVFAGRFHSQF
jgi:high affinity Mn2+ porin